MRPIVINARAAGRPEITGVERWAREMAKRLPELEPEQYVVARPPQALTLRAGQLWEQLALPAAAARQRAKLIYSPANLAPLAWPSNVIQIHDAVPLRHPEWYSGAYARWQRTVMPRLARRARLVITVSEFARAELAEFLGVPLERIRVVSGGVDDRFTPHADVEGSKRALGLDKPYVLTVGDRGPRKNLGSLEETIRALAEHDIELVVAGGGRKHQLGSPLQGARDVGYVPDELLPGLYAGALAFVFPSLHEGFGLPVLEAMASGVPVVASTRGALAETVGDAGYLVDPVHPEAMAFAVARAATEEDVRAEFREAGIRLASHYSWDRAARGVHQLLCTA